MKLYTGRGDEGQTDLFGGQRIDKDALRVEAMGAVDELNAWLGLAAAKNEFDDLRGLLLALQSRLFELGADLATPRTGSKGQPNEPAAIPRIDQAKIEDLEQQIDRIDDHLPTMKQFILPGGTELAAKLHTARTVCRRAERICVALNRHEPVGDEIGIYLNRLSDLLFAMARRANQLAGVRDVPWKVQP
ncbi:cob(I)yrinic acid a,c-diamide adenosyltransferase [Phycisphaerales bacterium AB-hyl4]|uniref:Corrinoid adenosyltransferase n=1 Tax=Natronomicrosphaera hydrolytica TaxID=3242702 RepID=A0ABV4U7S1_9BACT